jgi:hypothetical protein
MVERHLRSLGGGRRAPSSQAGLNSIVILGAWCLWKHRNDCVFNGMSPNLSAALAMDGNDIMLWELAGANGLSLPDVTT